MKIVQSILDSLTDAPVVEVRVGLHWTAVVVEAEGGPRCGLAATLAGDHHHASSGADVPLAGKLSHLSGLELAHLALYGESPTQSSLGFAAINALLPQQPELWVEANAETLLAQHGAGRRVALVGHFPFVPRLRQSLQAQGGELFVLEQNPQEGDLPAEAAAEVLPGADLAAITGMALVNHSLEGLLAHCRPSTPLILLGPSTPLSPLLFELGFCLISGAVVTEIDTVLRCVSQGGNFRQVHAAGVRLVNMANPKYTL